MNFDRIRALLLEQAIQGKLVPQLESEPAVDQITKETIDIPFEIPEKWKWARLDQVSNIVRGGSPRPIQDYLTEDSSGINWVKIGDADRGSKVISSCKEKIRPEGIKRSRFIRKGSLLLTNSMSYGYPYILNVDGCIHDGWLAFFDFDDYFDIDFLYYVLLSPFCKTQFTNTAAGAVVKNLNINKVRKILVPVPPIEEQQRITKKLECLFDLVQQTEKSYIDLQNLSNFLKKIILQQAIQGELVPQLESEPEVDITGEEPQSIPFNAPEKWKWVKFSNVARLLNGRAYARSELLNKAPGRVPVLRVGNFFTNGSWYYSDLELEPNKYCDDNDLLFAWSASFGPKIWNGGRCIYHYHIWKVICSEYVDKEWLYFWLLSMAEKLKSTSGRGSTMIHITKKETEQVALALPPIEEQRRIVKTLKLLFGYIDNIKAL